MQSILLDMSQVMHFLKKLLHAFCDNIFFLSPKMQINIYNFVHIVWMCVKL
jgi:hypothetical protein